MARHAYEMSLPSFRPSVYATGTQQSQPYTKDWPEGTMYGDWTDYLPWNVAMKAAVDVSQSASQAYQAKLAADEAERVRKAEEEAAADRATLMKVGAAVVLGVASVVLVQRYRKTGKIL